MKGTNEIGYTKRMNNYNNFPVICAECVNTGTGVCCIVYRVERGSAASTYLRCAATKVVYCTHFKELTQRASLVCGAVKPQPFDTRVEISYVFSEKKNHESSAGYEE